VLIICLHERTVQRVVVEPRPPKSRIAKKLAARRSNSEQETPETALYVPARFYKPGSGTSTHASKHLHYRNPHWRRQPYGSRTNPTYKDVWIEGMFINATDCTEAEKAEVKIRPRNFKLLGRKSLRASTLTQERLKELLHYNPDNGDWRWKVQLSNRVLAGSSAGTVSQQLGRNKIHLMLRIQIDGRNYLAHRLAFLYMLGRWPIGEVSHKNRNPMDYCWNNLREGASRSQQGANKSKRSGTSSRSKGAHWSKRDQVWRAQIQVNGKMISLGSYANEDEAGRAYNVAAIRYLGEYAVPNMTCLKQFYQKRRKAAARFAAKKAAAAA
jgi:hypothetical protein